MTDYSAPLIAIRQELNNLEKAILHGNLEKVPEIFKKMDIERDLLEFWYWKETNKTNIKY